MKLFSLLFKLLMYIKYKSSDYVFQKLTIILMKLKFVECDKGLISKGIPKIFVYQNGTFIIGENFKINNTIQNNPIGRQYQCIFTVGKNALLKIGNNVGMSGTVIVAHKEIVIEDNVKIGGNVCIYDSDFHSLNKKDRKEQQIDIAHTNRKSILIGKDVFIGAHTTILKGAHIGEGSIIGACSVVVKDIPSNEIWAGNPAKFIRKMN